MPERGRLGPAGRLLEAARAHVGCCQCCGASAGAPLHFHQHRPGRRHLPPSRLVRLSGVAPSRLLCRLVASFAASVLVCGQCHRRLGVRRRAGPGRPARGLPAGFELQAAGFIFEAAGTRVEYTLNFRVGDTKCAC